MTMTVNLEMTCTLTQHHNLHYAKISDSRYIVLNMSVPSVQGCTNCTHFQVFQLSKIKWLAHSK